MIGMYSSICCVMMIIQFMLQYIFYEIVLTPDNEKLSKSKRTLMAFVFSVAMSVLKTSGLAQIIVIMSVQSIISFIFMIAFLNYYYKEKFIVKMVHFVIILFQGMSADVLYHLIYNRKGPELYSFTYNDIETARGAIIVTIIYLIINMIYTLFILKFRKKVKISYWWIVVVMINILVLVFAEIAFDAAEMDLYIAFISIFAVITFTVIVLYINYTERKYIENEVLEMKHEMDLEKVYYEQVESRSEEMAKIRHDYNNIIITIRHLLKENKYDDVNRVLDELTENVSKTSGTAFCGVSIINAVLNEKKKICDRSDIELVVDIVIPNEININRLDLCMIFGNMLDNAIRACNEFSVTGKKGSIIVTGRKINGYIIFKVKNTSLKNSQNIIKGTGYGHKILSDIASKYNGDFRTKYKQGIYTSCISLND